MNDADQEARGAGDASLDDSEGRLSGTGGQAGHKSSRPPHSLPAYRLKRSVDLFTASDCSLYLLGGAGDEFRLDPVTDGERRLLELLSEGYVDAETIKEALASCGSSRDDTAQALDRLNELNLLEVDRGHRLLVDEQAERFDRQLIYFADLAPRGVSAQELQHRLNTAEVVVLGCGGLGSWTASALTCAGVGHLTLIDDDRVELSNLNRQILFTEADLGELKVEAAARALLRHDSGLRVRPVCRRIKSPADLGEFLPRTDLVIATADWPPHELPRWVNQACLEAGSPYITAGQFPPLVRIGPMVLPGRSACLECLERQVRLDYPLYDEITAHRSQHPQNAATVGAISGLVGSTLATEVIHALLGVVQPATVGTAIVIDLRTMQVTHEEVVRDEGCPICSGLAR